MAGGSPSPPTPIDPNTIIQAQEQANRINRITPWGSQVYGPNGLETQLSPAMQKLADKQMSLAGKDLSPLKTPDSFGVMQNSLMNKLQGDGGASASNAGKGAMQQLPQLQQMTSGFAGNPQNPQINNPLMSQAMNVLQRKY